MDFFAFPRERKPIRHNEQSLLGRLGNLRQSTSSDERFIVNRAHDLLFLNNSLTILTIKRENSFFVVFSLRTNTKGN